MVKAITVTFDDEDLDRLKQKKGKIGWREFILKLLEKEENERGK